MTTPTSIIHCLDASSQDKGGRVELETPAGRLSMTLPPGLADGQTLRLAGRGELGPDGKRGDVLLTVSFFSISGATGRPDQDNKSSHVAPVSISAPSALDLDAETPATAEPRLKPFFETGLTSEAANLSSSGKGDQTRSPRITRTTPGTGAAPRAIRPKKHNTSKEPPAVARLATSEEWKAGKNQAAKIWLLWWGSVMGIAGLECALLPRGFPFFLAFGIACPIALMALGIALARRLEPQKGTAVVLSWRRWVRYAAFVVWFSGIFATYFMSGEEGNWFNQHTTGLRSWMEEALSSPKSEGWPKLADWLSDALGFVEVCLGLFGVPVVLFWLSDFWPGYRDQQENQPTG